MPKIAGDRRFLTESLMCQNKIVLGNDSLIQRPLKTTSTPPMNGPKTVAVPPTTTATRNSIENSNID